MNFASDNGAGVHPAVMAALAAANEGRAASYGADDLTREARDALRDVLGAPGAGVHFVATGTAANALALAAVAPPWGRIFCHRDAHIEASESGAPEMFTGGAKLTLLEGEGGLIAPAALDQAATFWAGEGLGGGTPAAVSITNTTEWGRVWSPGDIAAIGAVARRHGLRLHMDGARLANAVAAGTAAPAALTHQGGVDILSFGGTKAGAMAAEAIVSFDPAFSDRLDHLRKRGGHLVSKHRYLAVQMAALLRDGLWLDLARHANEMALLLADELAQVAGARLVQPVESNQVFVTLPLGADERATAAGARYHRWPGAGEQTGEVTIRLVCAWDTRPEEVAALIAVLRQAENP